MKKISFILLISLLFSCSTPTQFGAGVNITFDPRTIGMQIDDTIMQKNLSARLALADKKYFLSIQSEVLDGQIFLSGKVDDPEEKIKITKMAWETKGVRSVKNAITIKGQTNFKSTAKDILITSQLRTALILNKKTKARNYTLETINKRIYIFGIAMDIEEKKEVLSEAEKIYDLLQNYDCGEVIVADNKIEQERIWKVRRSIGLAVKAFSIYKEEDTVVPRANLVKLLEGVKIIGTKYNFKSICYGHAGDGNLHVNILKDGLTNYQWDVILNKAIREIFELCVKLGGTISGEHGIGFVQKQYMDIPFTDSNLELQKQIKQIFDPNNILNPGKIFDI